MSWRYRVINFENRYSVHRVDYDSEGNPLKYEEEPIQIFSNSMDGLCEFLDDVEKSFAYPILTKDSFKKLG